MKHIAGAARRCILGQPNEDARWNLGRRRAGCFRARRGHELGSTVQRQDLSNWDRWLGVKGGGYSDSKNKAPLGLNNEPSACSPWPKGWPPVFGRCSGRSRRRRSSAIPTFAWNTNGAKKWPPREQPKHYRDTGILYWCIGKHGAGSGAWMRSVECNIMERGVGQWWAVAET